MPTCPVCHSSVDEVITQPKGVQIPSMELAYDLPSAIAAINSIILAVRNMRGPRGVAGKNGTEGKQGKAAKTTPGGKYIENKQRRIINKVVVHSSDDPDTTITFNRIDAIHFNDSKTNEPWDWTR